MFKALILSLFVAGAVPCQEELHFGLTCATTEGANTIANTGVGYALALNIERSGCQFMAVSGNVIAESDPFNIGTNLYSFVTIQTPDGLLYQLKELGEGFTA